LFCISSYAIGEEVEENNDIDIEENVSEDLILAVFFGEGYLSQGVFVKKISGEYYFPLAEIFSLLKFPIFVSLEEKRADGWFVEPSRSFELNGVTQKTYIRSRRRVYDRESIIFDEFDLYVKESIVENWFPLLLEVSESRQLLTISSTEELPLEKAIKRASRAAGNFARTVTYDSKLQPKIPNYRVLDWPASSFQLNSYFQGYSDVSSTYGAQLYGDLLGLNGKFSAAGASEGGLSHASLTLGRKDPDSEMFGPLSIAEFQLGDIHSPLSSLLGGGVSGRGFKFGNRPLTRNYDVNKTSFEGILKEGHDVEIYVNSRLTGLARSNESGRYSFDDIELSVGANDIRMVFYGPNGEEETVYEQVFVGESVSSLGQFNYDFVALETGKSVFNHLDDESLSSLQGILTSAINLSVGLGGVSNTSSLLHTESGETYLQTSFEGRINSFYSSLSLAVDQEGDTAYSLNAHSNDTIFSQSFGFSYKLLEYNSLGEEEYERLSDVWNLTYSIAKPFDFTRDRPQSWLARLNLFGSPSEVESLALNTVYDSLVEKNSQAGGSLRARSVIGGGGNFSQSLDITYNSIPKFEAVEARLSTGIGDFYDFSVRTGVTHNFSESTSNYSIGAQKRLKYYDFNVGGFYRHGGDYGFSIGVEFDLARRPENSLPSLMQDGSAAEPRIAVQAFVDTNTNGIRDSGEPAQKGASILRNGLPIGVETDFYGYAVVDKLSESLSYDLSIVPSSVSDPDLRPVSPKYALVARPGRLPLLELPLVPTGDLEGTITFVANGVVVEVPNIQVLIRNLDTGSVAEVPTEYDGLYFKSGLQVGSYQVEIDPEYLKNIGLVSVPEAISIEITQGQSFWGELDFVLSRE